MLPPTVELVRDEAASLSYGYRIVENGYRGLVVEIMVREAIGPAWKLSSANWNEFDFKHETGRLLEIKQSALLQPGPEPEALPTRATSHPGFGISAQKRYKHDIYVFAYHDQDNADADQRDARQWRFYVADANHLPKQKTIALSKVRKRYPELLWTDLGDAVEKVRLSLV